MCTTRSIGFSIMPILGCLLIGTATLNAADGADSKAGLQGVATVNKTDTGLEKSAVMRAVSPADMGRRGLNAQACVPTVMATVGQAGIDSATRPKTPAEDTLSGKLRCAESAIDIEIMTDNYPGETTWTVLEYPSLTVVCSGGPYANANTLYTRQCCVDDAGCYHFVIYDSYGDGICCDYGHGYYHLYYNTVLECSGGEFGSAEWCPCIGECPPDCAVPKACCVGNECYDVDDQAECDAMGGDYYPDNMCSSFVCPQTCPPDTIWGQITDDCTGSWSAATSGMVAGGPPAGIWYRVYEDFPQLACEIDDIHWWGLLLHDAGWNECANPAAVQFLIQFWADNAGMPDYNGTPVCSYGPLFPNYTALGGACAGFQLYYFSVDPLSPPCYMLSGGWVSIESVDNYPDPDCVFLWMSAGPGTSYQWEVGGVPPENTNYDRGVCLTGPCGAETGACCYPDGSCVPDMTPGDCSMSGGVYWGTGTVCDPNPCPHSYEPECPPDTIWGQPSMNCNDAWSAATSAVFPGEYFEFKVYEYFAGLPSEIADIHWWGLVLWESYDWFVCSDPLGMTYEIKFYLDNGGMPGTEICSYTVMPTPTEVDVCNGFCPLHKFNIELPIPCFGLSEGWVSIQSMEDFNNGCLFLWLCSPYGDGGSLQENVVVGYIHNTCCDRAICLTGPGAQASGPCCLADGSCLNGITPADCSGSGGLFMGSGILCSEVDCPAPYIPVCPANETLLGQPAIACLEDWTTAASYQDSEGEGPVAYEQLSVVTGDICHLQWWGLSYAEVAIPIHPKHIFGSWPPGYGGSCDPLGITFEVKFYPDDGTGLPDPMNPACTYTLVPTMIPVDDGCGCSTLWLFESELSPCCTLTDGWFSIRSLDNDIPYHGCMFQWFSSVFGDGRSLQSYGHWPPEENDFDLSFCLPGVPAVGACCLADTTCIDNQPQYDCEVGLGGLYMGNETACAQVEPCPQRECPDDSFYSQPALPCDFKWTAITSDADLGCLVYDNFFGEEDEVCNNLHWWGLSLQWNNGWSLCDPPETVFEIGFYPDLMGAPDVLNPVCTYGITPTVVQVDDCSGSPLWYFEAVLYPCCTVHHPIGWLSIQSTGSPHECAFLWFEGMPGDNLSLEDAGTPLPSLNDFDLSFCLTRREVCPGDSNCDWLIYWRDIDYFVAAQNDNVAAWEAMFLPGTPTCSFENNDVNGDGTVNWRDIDPFVALMNTTCP